MPRLYRQSPLNGVWEGSGNVITLDVLRAMSRSPESLEAFLAELQAAAGGDARFDVELEALEKTLVDGVSETGARRLVERMALLLQASLLIRFAPKAVADGFVAARLADPGKVYGALPSEVGAAAIVERALPA